MPTTTRRIAAALVLLLGGVPIAAQALTDFSAAPSRGDDTAAAGALVTEEMRYCAGLGPKPPGRPATRTYARHLRDRFVAAGLDTRFETFQVPRYDVSTEVVRVLGEDARTVPGESFAYSGSGRVTAEVVDVGVGREQDYAGVDAEGKIVMVERNEAYHRTSQLTQVLAHGGRAMLYVSGAPDNLVQTGAVRFAQDVPAPIPTMTVGADDGAALREQLERDGLRMRLEVRARRAEAIGRNVIGVREGSTYPDRYVVVAGHYDNWHAGAVDNCSGMASLLHVIEATRDLDPAYTVVFAAWDAEEIGLVGSYDFVRRHPRLIDRTVLNENLEMTSAATYVNGQQLPTSVLNLMFGTLNPAMNAVVYAAATRAGFTPIPTTATGVRAISGGIIPTDLQPFYSRGVQGFSTFSSSPYYHTEGESPERIDEASHLRVSSYLANVLTDVQQVPPDLLETQEVPTVEVRAPRRAAPGRGYVARIRVLDPLGLPVRDVPVQVLVNQRDHWVADSGVAVEVGDGRYRFRVPGRVLDRGATWLTVTVNQPTYRAEGYARTVVGR